MGTAHDKKKVDGIVRYDTHARTPSASCLHPTARTWTDLKLQTLPNVPV